jgi:hypothetical protein
MSILQSFENWLSTFTAEAEADLLKFAINVRHGIEVAETDIAKGAAWLTANLPQMLTFLAEVESVVAALAGAGVNTAAAGAIVAQALKLSQDAGAALTAYNADIAAGKSQAQALADADAAFVNAKAAAAQAATALLALPKK